jgi:2-polyprenyl-3-methyl-5-hydroxy-6-metoxy-1,4-benzoquinol methylase
VSSVGLVPGEGRLSVDRSALVDAAWSLYAHASFPLRLKQRLRPLISGMEVVFPHVPVGASVLDVGCGSGLLLGLLAQQGRRISGVGFDPGAGQIRLARRMAERVGGTGSTLRFECRDGREPWPERTFDVVTMVDVMHHVPVPSQREVFDKACAAVRPGGVLVYKDMGGRPPWRAWANQLHDLLSAREWVHLVPVATVEEWARGHAFELAAALAAPRVFYMNELRVFRRAV